MQNFPNAEIETAMNGIFAVEKVKEIDQANDMYALILMDINMPEMDGIEASRVIQRLFDDGEIRMKPFIAAITAYTSQEMKNRALGNGMVKFLTKPAQVNNIYNLIKQLLSKEHVDQQQIMEIAVRVDTETIALPKQQYLA